MGLTALREMQVSTPVRPLWIVRVLLHQLFSLLALALSAATPAVVSFVLVLCWSLSSFAVDLRFEASL